MEQVVITIRDNGKGFSPTSIEMIGTFGWTTKGREGHGMGLVLVELLATEIGGKFIIKQRGRASGEPETEVSRATP